MSRRTRWDVRPLNYILPPSPSVASGGQPQPSPPNRDPPDSQLGGVDQPVVLDETITIYDSSFDDNEQSALEAGELDETIREVTKGLDESQINIEQEADYDTRTCRRSFSQTPRRFSSIFGGSLPNLCPLPAQPPLDWISEAESEEDDEQHKENNKERVVNMTEAKNIKVKVLAGVKRNHDGKIRQHCKDDTSIKRRGNYTYLVLDTNVLIHDRMIVEDLVYDEKYLYIFGGKYILIIPRAVLDEIDRLKTRQDTILKSRAQDAAKFINRAFRRGLDEKQLVIMQPIEVDMQLTNVRDTYADDDRILNCASQISSQMGRKYLVALITNDINLQNKCHAEKVKTFGAREWFFVEKAVEKDGFGKGASKV